MINKENSHDLPHQNSDNSSRQEEGEAHCNENIPEKDKIQKQENPDVEEFREGKVDIVESSEKEKSQTLVEEKESTSHDLNKLNSKQPMENSQSSEPEKLRQNSPKSSLAQEESRQALADSFATIGKFFSVTKDNVIKQSGHTFDKITEIVMVSKIKILVLILKKEIKVSHYLSPKTRRLELFSCYHQ